MEEKELVECLVFLITKYIDDDEKKIMLIDLVKNRGSSVELSPYNGVKMVF